MQINRTSVAFSISAIWIIGGLIYAYVMRANFLAMEPTGLAEFLAGAFSPLAFLWLIVGYMQQGEELKQNTEALMLQAAELKQSAEQQKHLVEVTREQLGQERAYYQEERERMFAAAEPVFLIGQDNNSALPGMPDRRIRIANSGGTARALSLDVVSPEGTAERVFTLPVLDTGANQDFNIPVRILQSYVFRFKYRTIHGTRSSKEFRSEIGGDNIARFTLVES